MGRLEDRLNARITAGIRGLMRSHAMQALFAEARRHGLEVECEIGVTFRPVGAAEFSRDDRKFLATMRIAADAPPEAGK